MPGTHLVRLNILKVSVVKGHILRVEESTDLRVQRLIDGVALFTHGAGR
jgi:hypothetical protein